MLLLNIFGGVALILFGVRYLGKGLDRLFGHSLIQWLHQMTEHRLKAFGAGIAVSMVAPSSTTLSMVTLKMLHQGHLKAQRMLAVLLGTNIGVTITVQLLAFRIYDYYPLFLIIGIIGFQFLRRNLFRGIGQCILALGFIFLAMNIISTTAASAAQYPNLVLMIEILNDQPLALIFISAIITLMIQSSTAAIGIGLALVDGGLGGLDLLIPIVLGANVGIAGTAFIVGYPTLEGRRLGTSNLLLKSFFAAICLLTLPVIIDLFQSISVDEVRQGANFHTMFNALVAAMSLPFVGYLSRLVMFMIKSDTESADELLQPPKTYLDEDALESPSMGLINATREILSMGDEVKSMLKNFWHAYENKNTYLARLVQKQDDRIDEMNNNIKEYLSKMSGEAMGPKDTRLQFTLLSFSSDLEAIADIIDKNLCHQLIKVEEEGLITSNIDHQNLENVYKEILERFDMAINILASRDVLLAEKMVSSKIQFNDWCRELQRSHYENLEPIDVVSLESSSYFIDMLNNMRRINSHLTSVAYAFLPSTRDE